MDTAENKTIDIPHLKEQQMEIWYNIPETFPHGLIRYNFSDQKTNNTKAGFYVDKIIALVKDFVRDLNSSPDNWGSNMKRQIFGCGTDIAGISPEGLKLLLGDDFCGATADFITVARRLDRTLDTDDIFQALRNAWIMNCMQKLMGIEVKLTPSILAYSLLYPYTDNYLDDGFVSGEKKRNTLGRFEQRLAGECVRAMTAYEKKLFKLVEMIEEQFRRSRYPLVYRSLMSIKKAQDKSLRQQKKGRQVGVSDIFEISIEKGGASVFADGCLIRGELSFGEASFAFGLGILLQLLDDLQDAAIDGRKGHNTVFSGKYGKGLAETYTNRLINYTLKFFDEDTCYKTPDAVLLKKVMKESVVLLILFAAAGNKGLYSRDYLERLESCSPLGFGSFESLHRKIALEYGRLGIKSSVSPFEGLMAKAFAEGKLPGAT